MEEALALSQQHLDDHSVQKQQYLKFNKIKAQGLEEISLCSSAALSFWIGQLVLEP